MQNSLTPPATDSHCPFPYIPASLPFSYTSQAIDLLRNGMHHGCMRLSMPIGFRRRPLTALRGARQHLCKLRCHGLLFLLWNPRW